MKTLLFQNQPLVRKNRNIRLEHSASKSDVLEMSRSGIEGVIQRFDELAQHSEYLTRDPILLKQLTRFELARYIFQGPGGGGDPIRIGLFAGIHGDEQAGTFALLELVRFLEEKPELAKGYQLYLYPICNPTGFANHSRHSQSGKDLNREFWRNSPEPEVILLESEIRSKSFQGLISLHADDTSHGMYGFVRGAVLTRDLLEPALRAAEKILPRNLNEIIDGFPAANGIISECYDGILTSPPELHPNPFEIILETPHAAHLADQVKAYLAASEAILIEYQKFLSFAANL